MNFSRLETFVQAKISIIILVCYCWWAKKPGGLFICFDFVNRFDWLRKNNRDARHWLKHMKKRDHNKKQFFLSKNHSRLFKTYVLQTKEKCKYCNYIFFTLKKHFKERKMCVDLLLCVKNCCVESLLLLDQVLISPYLSSAKFLTEAPPSDGFLSFLPLFSNYAGSCVASRVFYKAGTPESPSRFYKLYPVTIFLYYYVTP